MGSVHGGYIATLLDAAMALSVQRLLETGVSYATTDLRVSYVRALAAQNGKVTAEGSVLHLGRSKALAEAKLVDTHGGLTPTPPHRSICAARLRRDDPSDAVAP